MKLKRIEAALLCAVLVASLCSVTSFASSCAQIRESVLRLHVLANSDSDCGPGAEATGAGCGAGRRCAYFLTVP